MEHIHAYRIYVRITNVNTGELVYRTYIIEAFSIEEAEEEINSKLGKPTRHIETESFKELY